MPKSSTSFSTTPRTRPTPTAKGRDAFACEAETGARYEAIEHMDELRASMLRALEILHAVRALFALKPTLTRAEFGSFVRDALERLPELLALAWVPRVLGAQRALLEQTAREEGVADFALREIDPSGRLRITEERAEYWPITYVEPTQANGQVLGLDLRANPCRRSALEHAALTGLPVATSPLRLAQLGQRRLGFLVVMSVGNEETATAGWVSAAFRVQGLVERIFAPLLARGIHLEISDVADESIPPFTAGDAVEAPAWRQVQDMPIAGRVWRFVFEPGPRFCANDPAWLARAAADLQRTNAILEQRVAARTADLEAANRELREEAARREAAELALARADAQLSHLSEAESRQWGLAGLVGRSECFGRMLREVKAVQTVTRTTVLLTGESGTGKELLARAIHYGSARATAPFVRVECATLLDEKAEVLLFGQERAPGIPEHRGYCELAEGGTLFFDEIGDLAPRLQARLLRVMEDGAYRQVGSEKSRTMSARVIAATHADLPAKIASGSFRQDLYYRLLHYHIAVPALRNRLEDVPLLAQHFVRTLSAELNRPAPRLRPDALQRLLAHNYPGNIRELKNTLERSIIYAGGDELGVEHIAFAPHAGTAPADAPQTDSGAHSKFLSDLPFNLAEAEAILVARAIAVSGGNLSQAARLLGVNRASLYRWQDKTPPVDGAAKTAVIR